MRPFKLFKTSALAVVISATLLFTACGKESTSVSGSSSTAARTSVSLPESTQGYTVVDGSELELPPEPEYTYTMRLASLADSTEKNSTIWHFVNGYNRACPDHAIEIIPIDFRSYENKLAERTKIMASINEGNGPDILLIDHEDLTHFQETGKLLSIDDLSPTLKAELIPGVVDLGTVNSEFVGVAAWIDKIYTCVIPDKYYSKDTWTITDILDIMDRNPEFKHTFVTQKEFNSYEKPAKHFIVYGLDYKDSGFVDYETNTAHFYTEEFVRLLEQMLKDSKNPDDYGFNHDTYLAQYLEISEGRNLVKQLERFQDGYIWVGIPSANNPGNRFSASVYMAVNKDCKDPEAALDFIKDVMYSTPEHKLSAIISGTDSKYEDFMINLKPCESDEHVLDALLFNIKEFINYGMDADAYAKRIDQSIQDWFDGNYIIQP